MNGASGVGYEPTQGDRPQFRRAVDDFLYILIIKIDVAPLGLDRQPLHHLCQEHVHFLYRLIRFCIDKTGANGAKRHRD
jgi:hypothetical protein